MVYFIFFLFIEEFIRCLEEICEKVADFCFEIYLRSANEAYLTKS